MKKKNLLLRLVVLLTAMMCALGAAAAEAYACYTPSNATLTFYYDDLRSSRPGTTYDLNTIGHATGWELDGTNANVTKVVFDPSFADARPTTTFDWFFEMKNLQYIQGLRYLNTSQVTDMSWMFSNCASLTAIDVAGFNTTKVTNMRGMFNACWNLQGLDLTSFNTSKVTNMQSMFFSCRSLQTIYVLDGWTTAAVTQSSSMFEYCYDLVGGNGTTWNSSNPKDKTYACIDGYPGPGYFTIPINNEPYACYTYDNTLSFHCDRIRSFRSTLTYDLNTGSNDPGWSVDPEEGTSPFTKVVFDPSFADARPTTTYSWFYGMENLQSITGIEYLNTSEVTNMGWMFGNCTELTSLDLSHFNTSQVTEMGAMFYCCSSLTSLDLSSFNTSKVTRMPAMFNRCTNLRTVYVSNSWSTTAVTYSANMFSDCTRLVGGQGTTYNASNPKDKTYAHIDGGPSNPGYFTEKGPEAYANYTPSNTTLTFYYDTQRSSRTGTTYDLNTGYNEPDWKTDGTNANVTEVVFDSSFANARPTTTYYWFYGMNNLQSITGMGYLNTSEVTNMGYMFMRCSILKSVDLSNFNTSKVTKMRGMFYGCSSLTSLDLGSFNTSKVTIMWNMFGDCSQLVTIYASSGWSTAAVTDSEDMFYNCASLVGGQGTTYDSSHTNATYAHIDGGPSNPGYFTAVGTEAYACYTPSNTTLTFYYDNLRSSRSGTTYDLNTGYNTPGWEDDGNNANVTRVVFNSSFAGARPTTTYDWFYNMRKLQSITGLSYLNTSEVTNMKFMFEYCTSLTSLDVSGFNTSKVTDMGFMFASCMATDLDVSNFNTSNVTKMRGMFSNSELESLDLSNFNTSKVTDMSYMFRGCPNLQTIYVGNGWSTAAVTASENMFKDATALVGGKGTTYDANHIDKAYAHIDGGTSNPGYFTDKNASLRGDVNGDGSVTIGDVTALIDYLLSGDASGINQAAADCNQDNGVSIGDVTALIDYLLAGSW